MAGAPGGGGAGAAGAGSPGVARAAGRGGLLRQAAERRFLLGLERREASLRSSRRELFGAPPEAVAAAAAASDGGVDPPATEVHGRARAGAPPTLDAPPLKAALGEVQGLFLGDLESAMEELVLLAREHDRGCAELSARARTLSQPGGGARGGEVRLR